MEEYNKECEKRKARSEKFKTTYVPPKLEDYLPWTEVKRIQDAEKGKLQIKGFATGIDLTNSEEIAKQEARKKRFASQKEGGEKDPEGASNAETSAEPEALKADDKARKFESLPVSQCWDKEEMLRPMRSDPPPPLWIQPPEIETETATANPESTVKQDGESNGTAAWVPEKIHICSIDWAAFKQIRNKDLIAFFKEYGATYVEWLGDLSCNVSFEDQYTAKRALMGLGQEIPSPPPTEVKQSEDDKPVPDFGNMTWRFCQRPIRKIANDKYGRKGTIARFLMRLALTTDILKERPNSWPAPPGGFSPKKVLGPNSDFKGGRKKDDKKKRKSAERGESYVPQNDNDGEHPMLGRSLSSGRQGFSLEDLERERASKKAKTSEE